MDWLEITGVLFALFYLFFEIKKKGVMWLFGIAMALIYIVVFAREKLYATMLLQLYYLGVSVYGWKKWRGKDRNIINDDGGETLILRRISIFELFLSIIASIVLYFILWFVLLKYTQDPYPQLDGIVTVLNILGTYWLSRSYIWQWAVWIIANGVAIALYIMQGLYPTAVLYFIYFLAAFYGFYYWKLKGKYN